MHLIGLTGGSYSSGASMSLVSRFGCSKLVDLVALKLMIGTAYDIIIMISIKHLQAWKSCGWGKVWDHENAGV